jgi:hypothetical protein
MMRQPKKILSTERWKKRNYAIKCRLAYAFFYRLLYMGLGFREKEINRVFSENNGAKISGFFESKIP